MAYMSRRYSDPYKDYDYDYDGFPGEFVYGEGANIREEYMDELWKRVHDFPDYWISNKGRLYSRYSDSFIYGTPTGQLGHLDVCLWRNGKRYHRYIHRLVGEAFIENPNNFPIIRHMDNDPSNNFYDNLKWGTPYDNVHDCISSGRNYSLTREDIKRANDVRRTPIIAINLHTGDKTLYPSQQEASRDLNISQASISRVLFGKSSHACGYFFCFENDPVEIDVNSYRYSRKMAPIRAINLYTGEEYIFRGQTEASKALNVSISSISNILSGKCHQTKGFTFEYIEEGTYER